MVQKYQSPVRIYKKPFEMVMAAYEKRFPTCDMIPVFVGCDILSDIESSDKATHTIERKCKLNVNAPFFLKRLAGCEYVYFVQTNALNRRERTLSITAYNESFSNRIVVNELCKYSVHPENSDWTCFEQSATLEVKSFFGCESMVEKLAIKQYTANIKKGKEIIEYYLNELQTNGITYIPTWQENNPHLIRKVSDDNEILDEDKDEDQDKSRANQGRSQSGDCVSSERTSIPDASKLDEEYIEHNLGMCNPIEESTLIQLRVWLSDTHNGKIPRDEHILRFLRSRDFNMEKARESLCQSLSWRKQHQIDRLLDTYIQNEIVQQFYLGGWHYYDIEGRPVYVLKLGQMDTKGLLKAVGEEEILKHILSIMEEGLKRCQDLSEEKKQTMNSWTCIVDLDGLSMRHLWRPGIQTLLRFIELIESNYPETMAHLLIVRAPRVFPVLWALLNPFIDEKTSSKFMMYTGSDYLKPGGLVDYINEEYIPDFLGGSCQCNIPSVSLVPKSLYRKEWNNRENSGLLEDSIYERANLFKGIAHEILIKVPEKEGVITWDFDSIRGDILFTLFYSNNKIFESSSDGRVTSSNLSSASSGNSSQNFQVIPKHFILDEDFSTVESGIICREGESVQGSHVARCPGFYILQWKWAGTNGQVQSSTVQDVFDQVTHNAKAKLMYYFELLPSKNFRGSMTSLESCQSAFSSLTISSR